MTRREEIRAAVIAALNADPPAGVPDVSTRKGAFSVGSLPAMRLATVKEVVERPTNRRNPAVLRRVQLRVECYVAGDEDDLEALLAHATATLVDSTLGGLAVRLEEIGTDWEAAPLDQDYLRADQLFLVEYVTSAANQEQGFPSGD